MGARPTGKGRTWFWPCLAVSLLLSTLATGGNAASGVYLLSLQAGSERVTRKVTLVR